MIINKAGLVIFCTSIFLGLCLVPGTSKGRFRSMWAMKISFYHFASKTTKMDLKLINKDVTCRPPALI